MHLSALSVWGNDESEANPCRYPVWVQTALRIMKAPRYTSIPTSKPRAHDQDWLSRVKFCKCRGVLFKEIRSGDAPNFPSERVPIINNDIKRGELLTATRRNASRRFQSCRSARMGSILEARRAGANAATSETAIKSATVLPTVKASVLPRP